MEQWLYLLTLRLQADMMKPLASEGKLVAATSAVGKADADAGLSKVCGNDPITGQRRSV
jgi:hypothetical protein